VLQLVGDGTQARFPVGLVIFLNRLFFLLQLISIQKKEHKLDIMDARGDRFGKRAGASMLLMPDFLINC